MTERGPGSGGAKRQKSCTEFTGIHEASLNSWNAPRRILRRTIRILARRSLVASGATPVSAGLSIFGVIGKTVRRVGGRVRLRVDRENRDQSNKAESESRGRHQGLGKADGTFNPRGERTL